MLDQRQVPRTRFAPVFPSVLSTSMPFITTSILTSALQCHQLYYPPEYEPRIITLIYSTNAI